MWASAQLPYGLIVGRFRAGTIRLAVMPPPRPCLHRGCPEYAVAGRSYCREHEPKKKPSPSTKACGDAFHKRRREALVRQLPLPCFHCGELVLTSADLDAHHLTPIAQGGPAGGPVAASHRRCNRSAGSRM